MTIKVTGLDKLQERVKRIGKLTQVYSKRNMQTLAKAVTAMIRERTTKGYWAEPEGPRKRFTKLELSTKRSRKYKKLHSSTGPNKSNLTESGQMIKSIKGEGFKGGFDIVLDGDRNNEIADYHQNQGVGPKNTKRQFMNLGKREIEKAGVLLRKILRSLIKSNKI